MRALDPVVPHVATIRPSRWQVAAGLAPHFSLYLCDRQPALGPPPTSVGKPRLTIVCLVCWRRQYSRRASPPTIDAADCRARVLAGIGAGGVIPVTLMAHHR
jgi:hypothetical protein